MIAVKWISPEIRSNKILRGFVMGTVSLVIINLLGMLVLMVIIFLMQQRHLSFAKRVMTALGLGIVFGLVLQEVYGPQSAVIKQSNIWVGIIGSGYVRLLTMIVMPLIIVSITSAITNLKDIKILGKAGTLIMAVLLATTAIAATVGIGYSFVFNLNAQTLQVGEAELDAKKSVEGKLVTFEAKPVQQQLIEIIPSNPFYAITGQGSNATLSVVFFSSFIGIAVLGIKKKKPQSAEFFINAINALRDIVMRLVTLVLKLTPYGVLALMTGFVSTSNFSEMVKLVQFVVASYCEIVTMFAIHMLIIWA